MTDDIITAHISKMTTSCISVKCLLCGSFTPISSSSYQNGPMICDECKRKWAELNNVLALFNNKSNSEY